MVRILSPFPTFTNTVDNHSHLQFNDRIEEKHCMYVCICRQITDSQIRELCRDGATNLAEIRNQIGVASECGKCGKLAQTIVKEFAKQPEFVNAG